MAKKEVLLNGIVVGEIDATGNMETDAKAVRKFLKEKGLYRTVSTDDAMHGQANSFAEVANDLYRRDLKHSPYKGSSLAPFIVNAALSIEIYLKAIHYLSGSTRRSHDLIYLYRQLSNDMKSIVLSSATDIRPRYNLQEGVDILACLKSLSGAFVNWRYLYEQKKMQAEVQSVRYTMHVTHEACCRARKQSGEK